MKLAVCYKDGEVFVFQNLKQAKKWIETREWIKNNPTTDEWKGYDVAEYDLDYGPLRLTAALKLNISPKHLISGDSGMMSIVK